MPQTDCSDGHTPGQLTARSWLHVSRIEWVRDYCWKPKTHWKKKSCRKNPILLKEKPQNLTQGLCALRGRGELTWVGSLLLLCESQGLNSGCQAWWQAPLIAELTLWSSCRVLRTGLTLKPKLPDSARIFFPLSKPSGSTCLPFHRPGAHHETGGLWAWICIKGQEMPEECVQLKIMLFLVRWRLTRWHWSLICIMLNMVIYSAVICIIKIHNKSRQCIKSLTSTKRFVNPGPKRDTFSI